MGWALIVAHYGGTSIKNDHMSIFPISNQEEREMGSGQEEVPFLEEGRLVYQDESDGLYTGDGTVDLHGKPVLKKDSGNWKACPFIIGTEFCERLAYYGIAINLVTYLTSKLHESNVSAARTVSTWSGTCFLTPLIGAALADAYWGRYWIIAAFSAIYFIGMCTLTLSASVPAFKPAECVDFVCPSTTPTQYWVFFVGLYLIALGSGGIKPCVSSFGADQFDDTDPKERVRKGSFFNWFYFSISFGSLLSITLLVYIQDNVGWGLGFGIPAVFMGFALGSFVLGTPLYRFQRPGGSPLTRMCQVFVAAFCKWNLELCSDNTLIYETRDKISAIERIRKLDHTDELTFLDKASVLSESEVKSGDLSNPWRLCTVTQVEELKILIRMFPIWATGIIYSAAYAQESTMFVEQGMLMDTRIGSFTIPPASLSTFDVIGVICWVPIYDRLIVPKVRKLTGKERGFTELQKMGIGLFLSFLSMTAAALVETKRLQTDIPISIFWQIPQYMLVGVSDAFMFIGTVEFFYDQSPEAMRSLCSALSLLTSSVGSYLSSFMLTAVTYITTRNDKAGWLPVNLNEGHLDYYFWLWGGLSFMNLIFYLVSAKKFKKKAS